MTSIAIKLIKKMTRIEKFLMFNVCEFQRKISSTKLRVKLSYNSGLYLNLSEFNFYSYLQKNKRFIGVKNIANATILSSYCGRQTNLNGIEILIKIHEIKNIILPGTLTYKIKIYLNFCLMKSKV